MSADLKREWGRSPMQSKALAEDIDRITIGTSPEERARLTGVYRPTIIELLGHRGVNPSVLERLRIEFLDADKRPHLWEIRVRGNDDLSLIKIRIFTEFGSEILTRLDLSLKD